MKIATKLQELNQHLKRLRINKYSLAIIGFIIWIAFFDKYNFSTQRDLSHTVNKLEDEKILVKEQIAESRILLEELSKDKEKYAREKYYMHAENEDVFVIKSEKN